MPKNIYVQIQIVVVVVFLLLFVICAGMLVAGSASDFVKSTFGDLKTLFLGLMAFDSLKQRIERGIEKETTHEKTDPADSSAQ